MVNKQLAPDEQLWRRAYRSEMQPGSDSCPTEDELATLVMGEIEVTARVPLADHIAGCRSCAEDYRTLVALHREAGGPAHRERARWRWQGVGVAAALIAAVGLTALWLAGPAPELPSEDAVRGGAQIAVPADGEVLSDSPAFSWSPQAGATGYRVRLYDEAAELLWESELVETTDIRLPRDAESQLAPGAAYFWIIEAEGEVTRPQLGPFWFRMQE